MPQFSKILKSQRYWKEKAIQRGNENRELRKTKNRHKNKISQLKAELKQLVTPKTEYKKKV
jgi:hypothetical protein